MKKFLTLILGMLFSLWMAEAATIQGHIYDFSLEPVDDVIVTVNSSPVQKMVSKNGQYSFELPVGSYLIMATHRDGIADEDILVAGEGIFVLDMILFPELEDDLDGLTSNPDDFEFQKGFSYVPFLLGTGALFLMAVMYVIVARRLKRAVETIPEVEKDYKGKAVEFIRSQGGRTTQRELRKALPFSEAKVSLIVSELEHEDKIKKIKKGRGNILVLK